MVNVFYFICQNNINGEIMGENELLEHIKKQSMKAQYYLQRYIDELKLHFWLEDKQIIKILETEIKKLKKKNPPNLWLFLCRKY